MWSYSCVLAPCTLWLLLFDRDEPSGPCSGYFMAGEFIGFYVFLLYIHDFTIMYTYIWKINLNFLCTEYWHNFRTSPVWHERPDSPVSIVLGYRLDGWGLIPSRGKILLFSIASTSALGPSQQPIQWVPGVISLRGGKEAGAWYWPLTSI
jgi:hypothetical protein